MNILLALDFSTHTQEVVESVKSLELAPNTKIYLFHVIKPAQVSSPVFLSTTPRLDLVLSRVWGKAQGSCL